jgi:hypothetical protein
MINLKSLAFTFCIFFLCLTSICGQNTVLTVKQIINFSSLTDEVDQYNRVVSWGFKFSSRKNSEYGNNVIYVKELIGNHYQQIFGYFKGENTIITYTLWDYGRWLGLKQQVRNLKYKKLSIEEARLRYGNDRGQDYFEKREFYIKGSKLITFFEDKPFFQMQISPLY